MDFGNAPRVALAAGAVAVPRSVVVAQPGSVAVDLRPEQTVQSARAGDAVQVEVRTQDRDAGGRAAAEYRRAEAQRQDLIERRLIVDPRTATVILQKSDTVSGEVIETVPDEATLRRRLYARALAERARDAGETPASIERKA